MPKKEVDVVEKFVKKILKYKTVKKVSFDFNRVLKFYRNYLKANPKYDYESGTVFVADYSKGDKDANETRAIVKLISKHCKDSSIVCRNAKGGMSAFLIGKPAEEIVSKLEYCIDDITIGKKSALIKVKFPIKNKLKCFGGEKVADYLK